MERKFKGVWIPKELWLSTELNLTQKALLVEIDSLDNGEHGCVARNKYFADFFGCTESAISKNIGILVDGGFVTSEIVYFKDSKQVQKRHLRVVKFPGVVRDLISKDWQAKRVKNPVEVSQDDPLKIFKHPLENFQSPSLKKFKDNNTVSINTLLNTISEMAFLIEEREKELEDLKSDPRGERIQTALDAMKSAGGQDGRGVIKDGYKLHRQICAILRSKPGVKKIGDSLPSEFDFSAEDVIQAFADEWIDRDRVVWAGDNGKVSPRGAIYLREQFDKWIGEDASGVKRKMVLRSGAKDGRAPEEPKIDENEVQVELKRTLNAFDDPALALEAWKKWVEYKKTVKKSPYRSGIEVTTAMSELHRLSGATASVAMEMVSKSILSGYAGFYAPSGRQVGVQQGGGAESGFKEVKRVEVIGGVEYPIYWHDDPRLDANFHGKPREARPGYKWKRNAITGYWVEERA